MKKKQAVKVENTHTIDLDGKVFGRVATEIALLLRGKNKVSYQPHIDDGDKVVAYNVKKIKFRGNKLETKQYYHYSGYPGGIKSKTLKERQEQDPARLLREAVLGMLPKNRLRKTMIKRLEIHEGALEKAKTK